MKIFLSSLENSAIKVDGASTTLAKVLVDKGVPLRWNLISFFYSRGSKVECAEYIRDHTKELMVDSGAHSLQFGKRVNFKEYTRSYCEFIKAFDRPNIVGFFEMDIDNVLPYAEVLELRKELMQVSDKIIPVWHPSRGIGEFRRMCEEFSGKVVSITGFGRNEIKDEQYVNFLAYAKKCGCKVHCLGMTRTEILDKVPFDYVDSSSWKQTSIYGRVVGGNRHVVRETSTVDLQVHNYKQWLNIQEFYYTKWRLVCKD